MNDSHYAALASGESLRFEAVVATTPSAAPAFALWSPNEDIRHGQYVLKLVGDYQASSAYDSEDVWIVQVNPPCPAGQPQIVLKTRPTLLGPWLTDDVVMTRDSEGSHYRLNLATHSRQKMGIGILSADSRLFARNPLPGWNEWAIEVIHALDDSAACELSLKWRITPVAFDPSNRLLACRADGDVLLLDVTRTTAAPVIGEIALSRLNLRLLDVRFETPQRLTVYTANGQALTFSVNY